jgi:UDP-3-O-[3-hydroxymyristoyl] glucosamine N-acyltransferase
MRRSLREVSEAISAQLVGDGNIHVSGVASLDAAGEEDLVFVDDAKRLESAWRSRARAMIVGKFTEVRSPAKALLISEQPKLAFARAAEFLRSRDAHQGSVHPTAVVSASARMAAGVVIEERVVVAEHAEIGESTRISAGCVIGRGVKIGGACEIYPNVTIYAGTTTGNRVIVHAGAVLGSDGFGYVRDGKTGRYEKFPQVGRLVIEDDVEIGANATIDRGALDETRIRRGVKIDNLVHVGHNCTIGEDVVIAAQTGISGSVVIENGVVCGGQVGIADHVRICEGVIVGAQGGIPSNKILRGKGVVFWGTPARPIREYLKQLAVLARLGKKE